jgi:hypothetical protein
MRRDWKWLVEGAEGWDTYHATDDAPSGTRTEAFDPPSP